ncbi:MAG: hypothetical protein WAN48_10730 [Actinomycetes bacterium]
MTDTAVAIRATEPTLTPFEVIERVIATGDLSKMSPQERIAFYWRTCESIGLNPLTRPFEFINLSGKLTMYAKKDATDQLRRIHGVSIDALDQVVIDDILTVTATGHTPDGRTDSDVGSVSVKGLSGDARANATKKAITQAKRRLTLSLVGLGFLDESEVEGAGDGTSVDPTTGEIVAPTKPASLLESVRAQQAAMAPTDAPDAPAEAASVPESTPLADVAATPDDAVEGDVVEAPASLTQAELIAALNADGIALEYAVEVARGMFTLRTNETLTAAQRAQLLAALRAEMPAVAGL